MQYEEGHPGLGAPFGGPDSCEDGDIAPQGGYQEEDEKADLFFLPREHIPLKYSSKNNVIEIYC